RVQLQKANEQPELGALKRVGLSASGVGHFALGVLMLPVDKTTFDVFQSALVTDAKIYTLTGAGRLLKSMGATLTCCSLYEWPAKQRPGEPVFCHLLGDMAMHRREYDAAIYYYLRTQELDPDNANLLKKLSKAYSLCSDTTNAAKSLEKVVADNAEDYDAM